MNARITELIKNPGIIQAQDLDVLQSEINKFPYLQNLRALHLIATHQFNIDDYKKELSLTAAYTTDKKILYQLINKKTEESFIEQPLSTQSIEIPETKTEILTSVFNDVIIEPKPTAKPVLVDGILNRILFEGEEDFLERETEKIDIESTLESGKLVTEKTNKKENIPNSDSKSDENKESFSDEIIIKESKISTEEEVIENSSDISFHETQEFLPQVQVPSDNSDSQIHDQSQDRTDEDQLEVNKSEFSESEDAETFTPEKIINEDELAAQKSIIENPSEISFHGSEEFMPQVQIKSQNNSESANYEIPKPKLSKQEEEMQLLIASVEAKMKSSKKESKEEVSEPVNDININFSKTQAFEISPSKSEQKTPEIANEVKIEEKQDKLVIDRKDSNIIQKTSKFGKKIDIIENSSWTPMQVSSQIPDSLIAKDEKSAPIIESATKTETQKVEETFSTEKLEERPVFNASFFTPKVSSIESKQSQIISEEKEEKAPVALKNEKSNIRVFINTWQNWLQIDRKSDLIESKSLISKEELKNNVIEKFIEKEPKISKLKDESDFVVKEKGSNISHLMTETLATLYVEQKLYAKAINGFEILGEKHPEKKEYFLERIKEIKDLRKNP